MAMSRKENPPFGRGETFYGQSPTPAIVATNLGGPQMEGKVWVFEDLNYNATPFVPGAKPARTNEYVECRIVRNVSLINLLPMRLVSFAVPPYTNSTSDTDLYGSAVDGYTTTSGQFAAGVVDEWLPAAGVAPNDLFWIVTKGPTQVLTPLDAGADNVFTIGQVVAALTAATSQATTAGRVYPQDLTGATSLLGNQVMNAIGRALSAATTANTGAALLVDLKMTF
jgi:hypothetical protein